MKKILIIDEEKEESILLDEKVLIEENFKKNKEYLKALNYFKSNESQYIQIEKKFLKNLSKQIDEKNFNIKEIRIILEILTNIKRNYFTHEGEIREIIKNLMKNDRRSTKKIIDFWKENVIYYWQGKTANWVKEKKKFLNNH